MDSTSRREICTRFYIRPWQALKSRGGGVLGMSNSSLANPELGQAPQRHIQSLNTYRILSAAKII